MSSRAALRLLRTTAARTAVRSATQKRAFVALASAATRPVSKANAIPMMTRGVKSINFGGTEEIVHERADWPREKLLDYFKNDTLALIGY